MKRVVVLGSTGSIGTQTLAVIEQFAGRFEVVGLSAGQNVPLLVEQIQRFGPRAVVVSSEEKAGAVRQCLSQWGGGEAQWPEIGVGEAGLVDLAMHPDADAVVVGLVGYVGLLPTLKALAAGKQVLTANKETLVVAGHLVEPYLDQIVPLDSEHSAVFQCLKSSHRPRHEVHKVYLTASGGPFRSYTKEQLAHVTVEQALCHPNWSMGHKVTIDSATMMNKGLEIMEAATLFKLPLEKIDVVVHPQSIVHSAVAFVDGSVVAQMGQPDMRVPLQYGLTYPERWETPFESVHLDLSRLGSLVFEPADPDRFPCLQLARWAAQVGGTMPVVLNAADEMAVRAFLAGCIPFTDIPRQIERLMTLHQTDVTPHPDLSCIHQVDAWCRETFQAQVPVLSCS